MFFRFPSRWAKETHDFIAAKWNSPDGTGGKMGLSLVSSTRLNLEEYPPIWHDIVYGFRHMSQDELRDYGRLNGKEHRLVTRVKRLFF